MAENQTKLPKAENVEPIVELLPAEGEASPDDEVKAIVELEPTVLDTTPTLPIKKEKAEIVHESAQLNLLQK